jgi:CubicO group peptidase (beta-lactamase class C family)
MAIENITGKNYTQLVNKLFAQPLELLNTFPSPGDEEKAVIPLGENTWGTDYGVNAPYVFCAFHTLRAPYLHALVVTASFPLSPT